MGEMRVPNPNQSLDLKTRVAILRKIAEKEKVSLPEDVVFYIARSLRNARALEGALIRLIAHSSLIGAEITLTYSQQVLKNFIAFQAIKITVDPFHRLPVEDRGTNEANFKRQDIAAAHSPIVFCLLKARNEKNISRVRDESEVTVREMEREQLARRDGYERALERRAKRRKTG